MSSVVGWYGPLIDLSSVALHIGDFVQLLVFVHRSTPVQFKLWKGGEVIRRDIQVGDDSRPYFPISIWQKQMASMVVPGDIVLLQNVKLTKYGDVVEGRMIHCSTLLPLIHHHNSLASKGMDELVEACRIGTTTKEKLTKVIKWLQRTGFTFCSIQPQGHPYPQKKIHLKRNWKLPEKRESKNCISLLEVSHLTDSCKAVFHACVGEIFLPSISTTLSESDKERMFISRRLFKTRDTSLVTDLICTGCKLCGSPLDTQHESRLENEAAPLYCSKSVNRLHVVDFIYRPFMLYIWDESEYTLLLVKNKAAELLFGNITAERVYSSFRERHGDQNVDPDPVDASLLKRYGMLEDLGCCTSAANSSLKLKSKPIVNTVNFYLIWLILLRALLQERKNSPLKFEVSVNTGLDKENGRFEMESVWIPFP
ncbi:uncharacterized protein LOC115720088 isoform X2 [Cannabis sativa]|uniref:uncharacterized protein LOC115720088 isoform X2 n=1 Tax=Cannabis sativa TaxID=3483 RepID=UPI0011DFA975|nr:uncharacterized protein LOC115720088 isoform X2 [Cannabis sativa]